MLSVSMSQNNASCELAEVILEEDRRDDLSATARGEAATGDTKMDLGPLPK